MKVELGNRRPRALPGPSVYEWTLPGASPEDAGWTLQECVKSIVDDFTGHHSHDQIPGFVVCDYQPLEQALAGYWAIPAGKPDNIDDVYLTRANGGV